MTDESGQVVPVDRRHAARQRARATRLLRRVRREHPQRQPCAAAGRRGDRRLGAGPRGAAHLLQAAAHWTDGRNASTIRGLNWSAGTFTFVTTVGAGANGLQTLLPTQGPTGTLSALTCGGSPRPTRVQTIKGIQYAMFDTITGTCQATYSYDSQAPGRWRTRMSALQSGAEQLRSGSSTESTGATARRSARFSRLRRSRLTRLRHRRQQG